MLLASLAPVLPQSKNLTLTTVLPHLKSNPYSKVVNYMTNDAHQYWVAPHGINYIQVRTSEVVVS